MRKAFDMIFLHAWESLNETFEARASEWALACAMITLGIVTLLNRELFDNPAFHGLAVWADRLIWAAMFLGVGVIRLVVLLINGGYWRTPYFRSALAFLSCFVWLQLAFGFAENLAFLIAILPWIFLLDAYNAMRAGREAGWAQFIHTAKKDTNNGRAAHLNRR